MVKIFIPVLLLLSCTTVSGKKQEENSETIRTSVIYGDVKTSLKNKKLLFVRKIGGMPSFAQQLEYVTGDNIPLSTISKRWEESFNSDFPDQFVVKKVFDSDIKQKPGHIVLSKKDENPEVFTNLNQNYLIFFDVVDGNFSYEQCYVTSLSRMGITLKTFNKMSKEALVKKIVKEKLLACF